MNHRLSRLIPFLWVTAGCAIGVAVNAAGSTATESVAAGDQPRHAIHAGPKFSVANPSYDFGRITQGQPVRYRFEVSNTGDETLEIKEVRPSCGCTTAGGWPHTLEPGESGAISVEVETINFSGEVTKTINVLTNDPGHPEAVLELKGSVWTPIRVANDVLIFPATVNRNESATRSTTIQSETGEKLALTNVRTEDEHFRPELKETVPGKEYQLTVTTVPPFTEGTHSARITMDTGNAKLPEVHVTAAITIIPEIQIAPAQVALMAPKLAAVEKRFAVVLSNRAADLKVTDVSTNAPGVTPESTPTADGKQVTIGLTFPAGFEITSKDHYVLRGKTNQDSVPNFEIPIVYSGSE